MRGATAADVAKELHAHVVKHIRRAGGKWTLGTVVGFVAGSPPVFSITLRGSSTIIEGVYGSDTYLPNLSAGFPTAVVLIGDHGDLFVACGYQS